MERAAWTDERLDDLTQSMRSNFDRIDNDLRDLRVEVREQMGGLRQELREEIGGVRGEIGSLRQEVSAEFGGLRQEVGGEFGSVRGEIGGLRSEIASLKTTLIRLSGAGMIGLLGIIAAILARG